MVGEKTKEEIKKIFGEVFSGGRYSEDAYITSVMLASSSKKYLENIRSPGLPNANSIHRKIKEVGNWKLLRNYYKRYVKERLQKYVKGREYYVLIDETPWAYYGKNFINNLYLWGYKKEPGSTASFLFLSALIVLDNDFKFYFDCLPVSRIGYFREECVESVLKEIIEWIGYKPKFVLVDRGFFSTKVIEKLERLGVKSIVHARQTTKIKKMMKDLGNLDGKFKYCLKNKVLTTLYIHHCKSSNITYTFLSNMKKLPIEIYQIYRKRWNIETQFGVFKNTLIKSKSTNILIRYFFILFAIAISLIHLLFSIQTSLQTFLFQILQYLNFTIFLQVLTSSQYTNLKPLSMEVRLP